MYTSVVEHRFTIFVNAATNFAQYLLLLYGYVFVQFENKPTCTTTVSTSVVESMPLQALVVELRFGRNMHLYNDHFKLF